MTCGLFQENARLTRANDPQKADIINIIDLRPIGFRKLLMISPKVSAETRALPTTVGS
jgi:hypothetical protein